MKRLTVMAQVVLAATIICGTLGVGAIALRLVEHSLARAVDVSPGAHATISVSPPAPDQEADSDTGAPSV